MNKKSASMSARVWRTALIGTTATAVMAMLPFAQSQTAHAQTLANCDIYGIPMSHPTTLQLDTMLGHINAKGLAQTGAGVDIALIDTGVTAVPGLQSSNKIQNAADFSFDAPNTKLRYLDAFGHGTNLAGIMAGDGTGGSNTTGVAPGARIINVKTGAADGGVDTSQVIAALDWVVQNKNTGGRNVRIINLAYNTNAWSSDPATSPLSLAVENAWKAGIVVVVSGGNQGTSVSRLASPAFNPYIIAVAGSWLNPDTNKHEVHGWSSGGDNNRNPDVAAPGNRVAGFRVKGSFIDEQAKYGRAYDNTSTACRSWFRGTGTSQSAAVVSGAVALLLQQRPGLSPDQVKALLMNTATNLNQPAMMQGRGQINVGKMLSTPTPNAAQNYPAATGSGTLEVARGLTHVGVNTDLLTGEYTAFKSGWNSATWAAQSKNKSAWTNLKLDGNGSFSGGSWSGASWSGASWSGNGWSGASWSGASWSGASWSGASWSGASWSGASWSGSTWSGASWSGGGWSGANWT